MLNNIIKTIEHRSHRYETVGDYFIDTLYDPWGSGVRIFHISQMSNEDYEFLVSIHEQIEEHLTRKRGIREEAITAFDKAYERDREKGDFSEPGDSPEAPYNKEHKFATLIEKLLAHELEVDWNDYEEEINNLSTTAAGDLLSS